MDVTLEAFAAGNSARPSRACAYCSQTVPLGSPHIRVGATSIELYCSQQCLDNKDAGIPLVEDMLPTTSRPKAVSTIFALGMGVASLSPCLDIERVIEPAPVLAIAAIDEAQATTPPRDLRPTLGPPQATEEEIALEYAQSFGFQQWVHPLPGPQRRMPLRTSRAFGANRPGHRPHECRSGHCGVDLGGEIWGEHIFATHDGIVDRINRNPNGNGGIYVRLSHLDGTVFTQYFHLAAIPQNLRPGSRVTAGQVLGLLGETGVKNSGPHLHFTVSVRPSPEANEVFIDPEPLIALWPVRLGPGVAVVAESRPGVPIGATGRYRSSRRSASKVRSQVATGGPADSASSEATTTDATEPGADPALN